MTSLAALTRMLEKFAPSANLAASAITVFPSPFGPTIAVKLSSNGPMNVSRWNVLNPAEPEYR